MRGRRVRLGALLALVACLPAAIPVAAAAAPGKLIRSKPYEAQLLPGVPLSGSAFKVFYKSRTATGQPTRVSGSVLIPDDPAPGRPLVGYAIGSQGLADRCAPSAQLAAGSEYEAALVQMVLDKGWTVALTDYPGLGTRGEHPYVVGRALGPAVLDSMRAARALGAAHLSADGPAALMGYSEGGGAAGWAAQLQPRYAPDIPLVGAAVGGVVADLPAIGASLDGSPYAFLLAYTFSGFDSAYPKLHLGRYLNERGRDLVEQERTTCIEDAIPTFPFGHASDVTTTNVFEVPAVMRKMRANSLGRRAPEAPVLLQHARLDQILPYEQAVGLRKDWCRLGADVHFRDAPGADHLSSGAGAAKPAIDYLAARFAGEPPPPDSC